MGSFDFEQITPKTVNAFSNGSLFAFNRKVAAISEKILGSNLLFFSVLTKIFAFPKHTGRILFILCRDAIGVLCTDRYLGFFTLAVCYFKKTALPDTEDGNSLKVPYGIVLQFTLVFWISRSSAAQTTNNI